MYHYDLDIDMNHYDIDIDVYHYHIVYHYDVDRFVSLWYRYILLYSS